MTALMTEEQFKKALPPQIRKSVNKELIDKINTIMSDPDAMEMYRENLLSYTQVLTKGKFKMESYLDAVRYVGFKLMGDSNISAFVKAFPDRYQKFILNGTSEKDIASYVTAYNKSKLVNLIFEQTLVPTHVLNADLYQKALNTQAELMISAKSEKVRSDAANSLINALKPPETKKLELDVTHKEDSAINELRAATMELVAQQRAALQAGATTAQSVAHSRIITDAEYEDVTE